MLPGLEILARLWVNEMRTWVMARDVPHARIAPV
jgi:hypothetical protein